MRCTQILHFLVCVKWCFITHVRFWTLNIFVLILYFSCFICHCRNLNERNCLRAYFSTNKVCWIGNFLLLTLCHDVTSLWTCRWEQNFLRLFFFSFIIDMCEIIHLPAPFQQPLINASHFWFSFNHCMYGCWLFVRMFPTSDLVV